MAQDEPKPRKKRRPHRRDQILAVATQLFHEKGYHATGMDDIGAAAGITGPAIYRHFKSKDDILETLLVERSDAVVAQADEIVSAATTPADALEGLVRLYVETLLDNPALGHVSLFERRTLQPGIRTAIERAERRYFEDWVQALCQVRSDLSDAEARVVIHAVTGLALMAAIYRSGLDRETLEPLIISMMTKALATERPRRRNRAAS